MCMMLCRLTQFTRCTKAVISIQEAVLEGYAKESKTYLPPHAVSDAIVSGQI